MGGDGGKLEIPHEIGMSLLGGWEVPNISAVGRLGVRLPATVSAFPLKFLPVWLTRIRDS